MERPKLGGLADKIQAEKAFREVLGWILKTDSLPAILRLAREALDAYPTNDTVGLTKTTVLDGHYASGDYECFCFDTHHPKHDHHAALSEWMRTHDVENDEPPADLVRDDCRVYPNALLPDGTDQRKGRWTITVTFEPETVPQFEPEVTT